MKRVVGLAIIIAMIAIGFLPCSDAQWCDWGKTWFPLVAGLGFGERDARLPIAILSCSLSMIPINPQNSIMTIQTNRTIRRELNVTMSNRRCPYCSRVMSSRRGARRIDVLERTRDHIRPKAWGGSDDRDNFRDCCWECNGLRPLTGHCHAALMIAISVAQQEHVKTRAIIDRWRLGSVRVLNPVMMRKIRGKMFFPGNER